MEHSMDAASMKARMRADLRGAMKDGRTSEAKLIRELIAAIDNAEAPPLSASYNDSDQHLIQRGSVEIERLVLSADRVRALLLVEIEDRERAAAEMARLSQKERALALRAQAKLARRYLE